MAVSITLGCSPDASLRNRALCPVNRHLMAGADTALASYGSVLALFKLGGLGGGFGGFGHKKKAPDTAQTQPAEAPGTGAAAQPASSVLIESSTTLSDFSSAPVDGSHFQVPTGYK
jgi:hypothetical protein